MTMPDAPSKIRWDKENTIVFSLKIMKRTEADIYEFLTKCQANGIGKGTIIKTALREYMENHKEEGAE